MREADDKFYQGGVKARTFLTFHDIKSIASRNRAKILETISDFVPRIDRNLI